MQAIRVHPPTRSISGFRFTLTFLSLIGGVWAANAEAAKTGPQEKARAFRQTVEKAVPAANQPETDKAGASGGLPEKLTDKDIETQVPIFRVKKVIPAIPPRPTSSARARGPGTPIPIIPKTDLASYRKGRFDPIGDQMVASANDRK
jgi:hypothetical protein